VEVCEVFPEIGKHIDDIAVIRSLFAEIPDHSIAAKMLMTGSPQLNKPSLGSWSVYGLGTGKSGASWICHFGGDSTFRQAAFLPGIYQGCNVNYSVDAPLTEILANISSQFSTADRQRHQIDLAKEMNKILASQIQKDAQLDARIEAFEIAFKMQKAAMDAFDVSKEPQAMRDLYEKGSGTAKNPKRNEASCGSAFD